MCYAIVATIIFRSSSHWHCSGKERSSEKLLLSNSLYERGGFILVLDQEPRCKYEHKKRPGRFRIERGRSSWACPEPELPLKISIDWMPDRPEAPVRLVHHYTTFVVLAHAEILQYTREAETWVLAVLFQHGAKTPLHHTHESQQFLNLRFNYNQYFFVSSSNQVHNLSPT
jgi:hypothetical protein